jgi:hypothetical protein
MKRFLENTDSESTKKQKTDESSAGTNLLYFDYSPHILSFLDFNSKMHLRGASTLFAKTLSEQLFKEYILRTHDFRESELEEVLKLDIPKIQTDAEFTKYQHHPIMKKFAVFPRLEKKETELVAYQRFRKHAELDALRCFINKYITKYKDKRFPSFVVNEEIKNLITKGRIEILKSNIDRFGEHFIQRIDTLRIINWAITLSRNKITTLLLEKGVSLTPSTDERYKIFWYHKPRLEEDTLWKKYLTKDDTHKYDKLFKLHISSLHLMAMRGEIAILRKVLRNYPDKVKTIVEFPNLLLLALDDDLETFKRELGLKKKVSLDTCQLHLLHWLICLKKTQFIKVLKADDLKECWGLSSLNPFFLACCIGHLETIEYFVSLDNNFHTYSIPEPPLNIAAYYGHLAMFNYFLNSELHTLENINDEYLLQLASMKLPITEPFFHRENMKNKDLIANQLIETVEFKKGSDSEVIEGETEDELESIPAVSIYSNP